MRVFLALLSVTLFQVARAEPPEIRYRLESDAIFYSTEIGDLARPLVSHGENEKHWLESYMQELRIFLKGKASPRSGYRIEPRIWYVSDRYSSTDYIRTTLDQGYAFVDFSDRTTFIAGKQRVRWGTGMTYTPSDRWQAEPNSLDPTRYLEGTFLFRMDATTNAGTFTGVIAPKRQHIEYTDARDAVYGLRYFKLVGTTDTYLSATNNFDDEVNFAAAFAWDSGPVVLYGEGSYLLLENTTLRQVLDIDTHDKWYPRAVIGASKVMGSSSAYWEVYYTGAGLSGKEFDHFVESMDTLISPPWGYGYSYYHYYLSYVTPSRSLHQWYSALNGTYNYHDLWALAGNAIVEPAGQTVFAYPTISFIGFENVDMMAGYSAVFGSATSERAFWQSLHVIDFRFVIHF